MSSPSEPRGSTDQDTAPLLQDPERTDETGQLQPQRKSFADRITALAEEPLTPLTRLLLVFVLALLLLTSVFIGLFAGAQHKLNTRYDGGRPSETSVITTTVTHTSTTSSRPAPTGVPEHTCVTAECIKISATILNGLDESKNPCDDMYDFASGGWIANHEIPAGRSEFSVFSQLSMQNKRIIKDIVESSSTNFSDPYDDQLMAKLRDFYSSCMNEELLDDLGAEPFMEIVDTIKQAFKGRHKSYHQTGHSEQEHFVSEQEQDKSKDGLTGATAYLHSRGVSALFDFVLDGDAGKDPDNMSLWFYQPELGLSSKEYYEEKDIVAVYESTIWQILTSINGDIDNELLLPDENEKRKQKWWQYKFWPPFPWPPWDDDEDKGPRKKPEDSAHLAHKVVEFEKKIAKVSLDLDLFNDPFLTYNPTFFSEFAKALPQIRVSDYISTMTPRNFPEYIIVTSPSYLYNLSAILDETPENVVEAYLIVRAALTFAPLLGTKTELWQAQRTLQEMLQGIKKGEDRSNWCLEKVEDDIGYLAGRFFIEKTFGGDSREKGIEVVTNVIGAFKESLKHLEWMDEESAKAATEKADALHVKVGYPLSPNVLNPKSLYTYYSKINIDKDKFFNNVMNTTTDRIQKEWNKVGKRRDKNEWQGMVPSTVNAYFSPAANDIVFPAGIMMPPFFSKNFPAYLSYGAFGGTASHELTHAFDSLGRMYNPQGKLEVWWTNKTSEAFNERQRCLADQFSNYTVDDGKGGKVHINGNLTSGENIGDSGLIQAYRAWRSNYDVSFASGQEYFLPGLSYTREQLFFIAYAQSFVQIVSPQTALQRIRTDPHSPTRYRVDGTLYNIPEFAEAFNCPRTAKLNPPPEKQCRFW